MTKTELRNKYMKAFECSVLRMIWNEDSENFNLLYNGYSNQEFEDLIKEAKKEIYKDQSLFFSKFECQKLVQKFEKKKNQYVSIEQDFGLDDGNSTSDIRIPIDYELKNEKSVRSTFLDKMRTKLSNSIIESYFNDFFSSHYDFLNFMFDILDEETATSKYISKLEFNLRLGEIGVFTKLLYDTKILDSRELNNKNFTAIFQNLCKSKGKTHLDSKNSSLVDRISYKNEKDVETVKIKIKEMLKILEEVKFE